MNADDTTIESYSRRLTRLADEVGEQPAITFDGTTITYAEFDRMTNRLARELELLGAGVGDFVTIAEPNSIEFLTTTAACWKIGATPQPVSARLPPIELDAIIELADPAVVVGTIVEGRASLPPSFQPSPDVDDSMLGDAVSPAWKAPTSGGSTGRPKLIVSGDPSAMPTDIESVAPQLGAVRGGTMVIPGPLYHNGPFGWSCLTLLSGGHVVLLGRFDAEKTLAAIQDHRATAIYLVPTMMQRMWKLPDDVKYAYDLSSLERAVHLAEPCPPWLKEVWINWIGAEVLWELFGITEGHAVTMISGTEWLEHRGSVGLPVSGELKITDEDGTELPAGETGNLWMRAVGRDKPTYRYIGAEPEHRDGWECVGDVGYIDDEGYLYLADRRKDMILIGGANVYPAEVEAAIGAHPGVSSCVVIGLPDDDKGQAIHAIVEPAPTLEVDATLTRESILAFLADRLVTYKLPRSFEFVNHSLRDDAGKVRRGALQAERTGDIARP